MVHDPALHGPLLWLQRAVLFVVGVAVFWVVTFWGTLDYMNGLGLAEWRQVWGFWCQAWPPADSGPLWLLFHASAVIALQLALIIVLVRALLWKKTGTVHHRGANFIDQRGQ